jgi:hypothetical protein
MREQSPRAHIQMRSQDLEEWLLQILRTLM